MLFVNFHLLLYLISIDSDNFCFMILTNFSLIFCFMFLMIVWGIICVNLYLFIYFCCVLLFL